MKKILFAVPMLLSMSACFSDAPSVESGQKIVEDRFKSSECIAFVNFKKDDGQSSELGGVKAYQMWYTATVELKPGCYGYYSEEKKKFWSNPNKKYSKLGEDNMKKINYKLIQAGEQVQLTGKVLYTKSEQGWGGKHQMVF